ncbi:MAG: hypothetical protein GXP14_02020, partial [Gammaproteobacteria bacterium]|nr:hypothetical protein [Gammaproteobacteria bacterium]
MSVARSFITFSLFLLISSPGVAENALTKTVAAVHLEKTQLKGKQVLIKGKVTKVNNGILKRNFLHVQDGSGDKNTNDLIVTSSETASVGDQVIVTG